MADSRPAPKPKPKQNKASDDDIKKRTDKSDDASKKPAKSKRTKKSYD